jgi:hypothetical protein
MRILYTCLLFDSLTAAAETIERLIVLDAAFKLRAGWQRTRQ